MRKPCIITIDPDHTLDDTLMVHADSGDISFFEILQHLKGLEMYYGREIMKVAKKEHPNDEEAQLKWINEQMRKYNEK